VIRGSALLTSVSEPWARQLEFFHRKKAEVITNGFDLEDYSESVPLLSKFTITYTGSLFPHDQNPLVPILEAVAELADEGRISPDKFEIRFFGGNAGGSVVSRTVNAIAGKMRIKDFVNVYDLVPFKECVRKQKESTALLLLRQPIVAAEGWIPGKTFEYLGAKRPILALALNGGIIEELLKETGAGLVANDKSEIKATLLKWIEEFAQSGHISTSFEPNDAIIEKYTRQNQAKRLSELMDELVNH